MIKNLISSTGGIGIKFLPEIQSYLIQGTEMLSIDDVVVATKGVDLGQMVVAGLSAGGFYVHVKVGEMTLTYPAKDLKKA